MTQNQKIVKYLTIHESISTLEACIALKITKLPTRIGELEKIGYRFKRRWETSKDELGNQTRYLRYSLEV